MRRLRTDALALALVLFAAMGVPRVAAAQSGSEAVLQRVAAMQSAMNAHDLDGVLATLDPDVIVTWQHGGVARGHAGVREYWARVLRGRDAPVKGFSTSTRVAPQAVLHGRDIAVVFGVIRDRYVLTGGVRLDLDVFWSATALRQDGGWRFVSVHFSNNTFDNAVLDKVKGFAWWGAAAGVAAGAAAMWLLMRVRAQSKPKGG